MVHGSQPPSPAPRSARRIAAIFLAVAIIWIAGSHLINDWLASANQLNIAGHIVANSLFALLATAVVYWLVKRDLTERQRADQRQQTSEESYRLLFEGNPYPMWVYDPSTLRFLAVNDAAIAHYGYSRDELLSMTLADIRPSEDVPALRAYLAAPPESGPQSRVWRHRKKDGTLIDVEVNTHAFEFRGQPARLVLALDVTERLRAERERAANEAKARLITAQMPTVLWTTDHQLRITSAMGGRLARLNFSEAEYLQRTLYDLTGAPDDDVPMIRAHRQALAGESAAYELRVGEHEFDVRVVPLRDADGAIIGCLAVALDVTERLRAERALQLSEASMRAVFESSHQSITLLDRQFIIRSFNGFADEHARAVFGRPMEIGKSVLEYIKPEERESFERAFANAFRGESIRMERAIHGVNGTEWWKFYFNPIVAADGTTTGASFVARNITERKRTQERLRTVVNNAPVILFALDHTGVFTVAQGRMLQQMGVTDDQIVGQSIFELYRARPDITAHVRRALDGEEHTSIERTMGFFFETRWTPLFDLNRRVVGVIGVAADVTDRMQAETRLRELQSREQAIINGTADCIFLKDREGRYLLCNEATAALAGRSVEEMLGRTDADLFPPEVARRAAHADRRVIETGESLQYEEPVETSDGQRITFLTLKAPYRDASGDVRGVIGVARDITERTAAEEALRRSETTNRVLLDALPDLMFRLSRDGRVLDHRAGDHQPFFAPPHTFTGRAMDAVFPPPVARQAQQAIDRAFASGAMQMFEYELSDTSQPGFYEMRVIVSGDNEALAIIRDISDRKRAERVLRDARDVYLTLVEEAPMLVWRTDMSGHCTFVNKQWIAFTGGAPEGSLLDSFGDPLHPDDRESFAQAFMQAIAERSTFEFEARLRRQDGTYRWMVIRSSPFFDDSGAAAGFISTAIDITERKQQERIKDDFLALASHELKTPVAALIGYVHLLRRWFARDNVDERSHQALTAMAAESERLDRLINDLLDVSRIQTGRVRLDPQPTELCEFVAQVVAKLRMTITTHELVLQLADDSPITAQVDAGRIEQVIANLIINAAKYSPPPAPILISVRANGDNAVIDVIDHGIGIPPQDTDHIFDRFYQVQRPARESRPGLGLGLYIAREIVRQHGGDIEVRSREMRGSRFRVQLPLARPSEELIHDGERVNELSP